MNQYYGYQPGTIPEMEKIHGETVRDIAARGMVLMEYGGGLPLKEKERVALFGHGARNTAFCGLGAASFTSREEITIEEGLERAGITITSKKYLDRYEKIIKEEEKNYYDAIRRDMDGVLIRGVIKMYGSPLVPSGQPLITEEDLKDAEAETAIYVITRTSGEGADRKMEEGDYLLAEEEKRNLEILSGHYQHLVVLLNVGSPMDTAFIRQLPNLGALLMVGYAAGATGLSVADILTGKVVPEGKLTDTWAEKYEDYPNAMNYGAMNGNLDDEYYSEGIYVGYRYFDSFGIRPAYPFGYGLSYTTFGMTVGCVAKEKGKIFLSVEVENQGKQYAGREVVQVYVSAPSGKLEKPYQELKGYAKTGLLQPGEKETVCVELEIRSFASYSAEISGWVLEEGDYLLRVGNSSRNTRIAAAVRVKETMLAEQCQNLFAPDQELVEMTAAGIPREVRAQEAEVLQSAEDKALQILEVDHQDVLLIRNQYRKPLWEESEKELAPEKERNEDLRYEQVLRGEITLDELVDSLSAEELSYLCVGNVGDNKDASFICSGSGSSSTDATVPMVPGSCDSTRELLSSRGIPNMHMGDGGNGVRLLSEYEVTKDGELLTDGLLSVRGASKILGRDYIQDRENNLVYEQYTTGFPIAPLLAQTWDRELAEKCGQIGGKEMQNFHVELWLAPAMNIHRNPLCGRNFEYYSEDPFLTGESAAAVIKGIQSSPYVGVTIKHYACNNQEDNRHANNVHISERALREIYLKGYEIAVRKSHPLAIMSSYNLVNGVHSANSYELLTTAARDEWGFDGLVMTDWGTTSPKKDPTRKYQPSTCAGCMRAGNDLIMPGASHDLDNLYASIQNGEITMGEVRLCAKRILQVMMRLCAERI